MSNKSRRILGSPAFIVAVAFAVRLAAMVYMQSYLKSPARDHFGFGGELGRVARSIASGKGFTSPYRGSTGPTAVVPPAYPYLLAAIFKLSGTYTPASASLILSLNSLFSALTCLMIFLAGRRIFGRAIGAWGAWAWAFFPYAVWWPTVYIWETSLSALLVSAIFLATLKLDQSARFRDWVGYGLLWGLTGLSNTTLLTLIPFFLGWLCCRKGHRGEKCVAHLTWAALAFALTVAPWAAHNYRAFGRFVFRSNFGLELWRGNHQGTEGFGLASWRHPGSDDGEFAKYRAMGELDYMAEKQRQAFEFITSHPGRFVWLSVKRFVYYWTGTWELILVFWFSGRFIAAKFAFYSLVSGLAFLGLRLVIRERKPEAALFAILLGLFPLTYYITHIHPRYRHPIEPAMVLLSVLALSEIASKARERLRSRRPHTSEALNP